VASSPYTYTPVPNDPPASFTDATLAPEIITCVTPTIIRQPESKAVCLGKKTRLDVLATPTAACQWYEKGNHVLNGSGGTTDNYITPPLDAGTSYSVTASIGACSVSSETVTVSITANGCPTAGDDCTPPEAAVNFADFKPCNGAATGTTWYLTDTRDYSNGNSYKVQKMPDGKIWMIQGLKFGNCGGREVWGLDDSVEGTLKSPTVAPGYVGHCIRNSKPAAAYHYTWAATMNNQGGYEGGTWTANCIGSASGESGPNKEVCRGICPVGWHVPTAMSTSDISKLFSALASYYKCEDWACWESTLCSDATMEMFLGNYNSNACAWTSSGGVRELCRFSGEGL
jgi:uncharacterized protein (TIGR02145 family)